MLISALGMVLILHALGVLVILLLIAFGVVSITVIQESYVETTKKENLDRR